MNRKLRRRRIDDVVSLLERVCEEIKEKNHKHWNNHRGCLSSLNLISKL